MVVIGGVYKGGKYILSKIMILRVNEGLLKYVSLINV